VRLEGGQKKPAEMEIRNLKEHKEEVWVRTKAQTPRIWQPILKNVSLRGV